MRYVLILGLLLIASNAAFAQDTLSKSQKIKSLIQTYFEETGKQIIISDKDLSTLKLPKSEFEITQLPELLIEDIPYQYFEFKDLYIIVYPESVKETIRNNGNKESTLRKTFTIKGIIKDDELKSSIPGALFSIPQIGLGIVTSEKGEFEISVPGGTYLGYFSAGGKITERKIIRVYQDMSLEVNLFDSMNELELVTVFDRPIDSNVSGTLSGVSKIEIENLKLLPPLLGEVDVIKGIMLLPGVSSTGEGSSGFNVRGGGIDQNLILLDGAPVFNPTHLFGFFGIFNQDAIRSADLYKGDIPANFGGRISSVLDIQSKPGQKEKWDYTGGLGLLSLRFGTSGPLSKNTQIRITGRSAFPNWIIKQIPNTQLQNSSTYFHDGNVRVDKHINSKNSLALSIYSSNDYFKFGADTTYNWNTNLASLTWTSIISNKINSDINLTYSGYDYKILGSYTNQEYNLTSNIKYYGIKQILLYNLEKLGDIKVGYQISNYRLGLGNIYPTRDESIIPKIEIPDEHGLEAGAFLEIPFKINEKIQFQGGARFSTFLSLGPKEQMVYQEGKPKDQETIIDTIFYQSGKIIKRYSGIEPRLAVRHLISESFSIKTSINRSLQYIHLLSNNFAAAPVDLWKLSDKYTKPQEVWQYAMGLYKNFKKNTIETSVEFYYKSMGSILEYKDGANLILNPTLETDLVSGNGYAYGTEFLIKKNTGKTNGWISYTYSRSLRRVNTPEGIQINEGDFFPSNWDSPHDITIVGNHQPKRRISINATFNYRTGRPITLPNGLYYIDGVPVIDYQERNQSRIPDYHRLDLGLTYYLYSKKTSTYKSYISLSIYNAYGRKNAFSWFFQPSQESAIPKSYRLSVIGTVVPSITYNFSIR